MLLCVFYFVNNRSLIFFPCFMEKEKSDRDDQILILRGKYDDFSCHFVLVSFVKFIDCREFKSCLICAFHYCLFNEIFVSKVNRNRENHAWLFWECSSHLLDSLNVNIFYSSLIFFDLIWSSRKFDDWS